MAGDQACCQRILAREFLERLAIDEFLEPDEDLCFCTLCADQRRDFPVSFASEDLVKFSTPLGWYRAGLCVDPQFVEENDVERRWHAAYLGLSIPAIQRVLSGNAVPSRCHPQFVDSGGKASGSADKKERTSPAYSGCPSGSSTVTRFNKWMSALELFERKQIFSSPSLAYAGSSLLSPAMPFASSTGCGYYAQACLFVRQAPSHGVGPQSLCSSQGQGLGGECGPCGGSSSSTAGGEGPPCGGAVGPNRIDPNFPNECLEWYTTKWADVLPVALVVRLTPTGVAAARGVSVCMNPSAAGWAAPDRCKKGTNAQLALKEKRLTEKLEEREKAAKGNGRGMMLGDFLRDTVGGGIGGIGSSGWGSGGIPFSETDVLSESFALWDLAFLENRAALALGDTPAVDSLIPARAARKRIVAITAGAAAAAAGAGAGGVAENEKEGEGDGEGEPPPVIVAEDAAFDFFHRSARRKLMARLLKEGREQEKPPFVLSLMALGLNLAFKGDTPGKERIMRTIEKVLGQREKPPRRLSSKALVASEVFVVLRGSLSVAPVSVSPPGTETPEQAGGLGAVLKTFDERTARLCLQVLADLTCNSPEDGEGVLMTPDLFRFLLSLFAAPETSRLLLTSHQQNKQNYTVTPSAHPRLASDALNVVTLLCLKGKGPLAKGPIPSGVLTFEGGPDADVQFGLLLAESLVFWSSVMPLGALVAKCSTLIAASVSSDSPAGQKRAEALNMAGTVPAIGSLLRQVAAREHSQPHPPRLDALQVQQLRCGEALSVAFECLTSSSPLCVDAALENGVTATALGCVDLCNEVCGVCRARGEGLSLPDAVDEPLWDSSLFRWVLDTLKRDSRGDLSLTSCALGSTRFVDLRAEVLGAAALSADTKDQATDLLQEDEDEAAKRRAAGGKRTSVGGRNSMGVFSLSCRLGESAAAILKTLARVPEGLRGGRVQASTVGLAALYLFERFPSERKVASLCLETLDALLEEAGRQALDPRPQVQSLAAQLFGSVSSGGAAELIGTLLRSHSADSEVVRRAVRVAGLLCQWIPCREDVMRLGLDRLIVFSVLNLLSDAPTVTWGLEALAALAEGDSRLRLALLGSGAPCVAVEALTSFRPFLLRGTLSKALKPTPDAKEKDPQGSGKQRTTTSEPDGRTACTAACRLLSSLAAGGPEILLSLGERRAILKELLHTAALRLEAPEHAGLHPLAAAAPNNLGLYASLPSSVLPIFAPSLPLWDLKMLCSPAACSVADGGLRSPLSEVRVLDDRLETDEWGESDDEEEMEGEEKEKERIREAENEDLLVSDCLAFGHYLDFPTLPPSSSHPPSGSLKRGSVHGHAQGLGWAGSSFPSSPGLMAPPPQPWRGHVEERETELRGSPAEALLLQKRLTGVMHPGGGPGDSLASVFASAGGGKHRRKGSSAKKSTAFAGTDMLGGPLSVNLGGGSFGCLVDEETGTAATECLSCLAWGNAKVSLSLLARGGVSLSRLLTAAGKGSPILLTATLRLLACASVSILPTELVPSILVSPNVCVCADKYAVSRGPLRLTIPMTHEATATLEKGRGLLHGERREKICEETLGRLVALTCAALETGSRHESLAQWAVVFLWSVQMGREGRLFLPDSTLDVVTQALLRFSRNSSLQVCGSQLLETARAHRALLAQMLGDCLHGRAAASAAAVHKPVLAAGGRA